MIINTENKKYFRPELRYTIEDKIESTSSNFAINPSKDINAIRLICKIGHIISYLNNVTNDMIKFKKDFKKYAYKFLIFIEVRTDYCFDDFPELIKNLKNLKISFKDNVVHINYKNKDMILGEIIADHDRTKQICLEYEEFAKIIAHYLSMIDNDDALDASVNWDKELNQ